MNNFVEGKNAHSNKANFTNFNIQTSNKFDNLRSVENTHHNFDDVIEIGVAIARQSPFVKFSKSRVKKRPDVVANKYPENQHVFGKEIINVKRRQETYTDVVQSNINS